MRQTADGIPIIGSGPKAPEKADPEILQGAEGLGRWILMQDIRVEAERNGVILPEMARGLPIWTVKALGPEAETKSGLKLGDHVLFQGGMKFTLGSGEHEHSYALVDWATCMLRVHPDVSRKFLGVKMENMQ